MPCKERPVGGWRGHALVIAAAGVRGQQISISTITSFSNGATNHPQHLSALEALECPSTWLPMINVARWIEMSHWKF